MPPKRRKATEPSTTPAPKRRSTRASKSTTSDVKSPIPKIDKPKTPKAKPSRPKSGKAVSTSQATQESTNTSNQFTTVSITHSSLKNSILCQMYTPSTPTPSSLALIFTHGAGGTLSAPAVVNFCTGFCTTNPVFGFQGNMNLTARVKGFHALIEHLIQTHENKAGDLVLGGRSMGARAAVMAASEVVSSKSSASNNVLLILVSYPLQGPKDIRDQILLDLPADVSVLFIIGSKDSMCPLELLNGVRQKMKAKSWLLVVKDADHGMHVSSKAAERGLGEMTGRMAAEWVGGRNEETEEKIWWGGVGKEVKRSKWEGAGEDVNGDGENGEEVKTEKKGGRRKR
ncbi:hypothetical protein K469DRAFT_713411 [Zopfia rhizophila CBS 207.26]|uniref:KANL3/Tex30 alpha/beta hydrolase-like domain-containing protein n=1 Tax=Zopfia rhizophila CBS 207.26 TaxID=1314779 RepID=A0A6A6DUB4_9PEZI|nr:hypothetical protein K469DRAFT_713411 [Zopfia rhizophila CBS 207.26]